MTQILKSGFEALWQEWKKEVLSHPQAPQLLEAEIKKLQKEHPD